MKHIKLSTDTEEVIIDGSPVTYKFDTRELIKIAVNVKPDGGYTVSDMRDRMKILDALDKLGDGYTSIVLEDTEFNNLKQYVGMTRWSVMSKTIVKFVEQFK